nr:MAG TPA: hypothetical protein [Caudoviricetes sp.]
MRLRIELRYFPYQRKRLTISVTHFIQDTLKTFRINRYAINQING